MEERVANSTTLLPFELKETQDDFPQKYEIDGDNPSTSNNQPSTECMDEP